MDGANSEGTTGLPSMRDASSTQEQDRRQVGLPHRRSLRTAQRQSPNRGRVHGCCDPFRRLRMLEMQLRKSGGSRGTCQEPKVSWSMCLKRPSGCATVHIVLTHVSGTNPLGLSEPSVPGQPPTTPRPAAADASTGLRSEGTFPGYLAGITTTGGDDRQGDEARMLDPWLPEPGHQARQV